VTDVPPPALYRARTVHIRFAPFERRFSYDVFQIFLDIDAIGETARRLRTFSYNRAGLFSFHDRDHGDRTGAPLRAWAERALESAGVRLDGGPIRLLTFPRILGYVFNPLSVFFGYGPSGDLRGVVFEVNNTFGETHAYAAAFRPDADLLSPKRFHVSPFFDVAGAYRFRLSEPGAAQSLVIENFVDGARTHLASLRAKRVRLSDATLLAAALAQPFMTLKVIAAIHWEALWLWRRGARYRSKPSPPAAPVSAARTVARAAGLSKPVDNC
jgi:DUF1365 family protein